MSSENKYTKAVSYREKYLPQAEKLLRSLFSVPQETSHEMENFSINHLTRSLRCDNLASAPQILIIGSGQFPSFTALKNILSHTYPLHFTLLEPNKKDTDFFVQYFKTTDVTFSIINKDLAAFLKSPTQKFDLIYFEHPETMTLPLILGKLGVKSLKRTITFRECFPYLNKILKPNSIILGSCMSTHELLQLKNLLKFSLNLTLKTSSLWNPLNFFYGGPYRLGLIARFQPKKIFAKNRVRAIRYSHHFLCLFLFLSFFIYIFYCSQYPGPDYALERLTAVILIGAQLYLHKEGVVGVLIKVFLLVLQIALFITLA